MSLLLIISWCALGIFDSVGWVYVFFLSLLGLSIRLIILILSLLTIWLLKSDISNSLGRVVYDFFHKLTSGCALPGSMLFFIFISISNYFLLTFFFFIFMALVEAFGQVFFPFVFYIAILTGPWFFYTQQKLFIRRWLVVKIKRVARKKWSSFFLSSGFLVFDENYGSIFLDSLLLLISLILLVSCIYLRNLYFKDILALSFLVKKLTDRYDFFSWILKFQVVCSGWIIICLIFMALDYYFILMFNLFLLIWLHYFFSQLAQFASWGKLYKFDPQIGQNFLTFVKNFDLKHKHYAFLENLVIALLFISVIYVVYMLVYL